MKTNTAETALDIAHTFPNNYKMKSEICNYLEKHQSQDASRASTEAIASAHQLSTGMYYLC